jgi:hypothetical protein
MPLPLLLPSLLGSMRKLYRNRLAAIGPRDPAQIAAPTEARAALETASWRRETMLARLP